MSRLMWIIAFIAIGPMSAGAASPSSEPSAPAVSGSAKPEKAETPSFTEKLNAYVACINRLSERSYDSRERYFSWVGKKAPPEKSGSYTAHTRSMTPLTVRRASRRLIPSNRAMPSLRPPLQLTPRRSLRLRLY